MVPEQSIVPKINEHLPPEIRVIGEFITSNYSFNILQLTFFCDISVVAIFYYLTCHHFFVAMKRTTRGFDAKGNCSARTYEYLTPTYAFAKDYVSLFLC